jgi:hypothetical protein
MRGLENYIFSTMKALVGYKALSIIPLYERGRTSGTQGINQAKYCIKGKKF